MITSHWNNMHRFQRRSSELSQMIAASPDLLERVTRSSLSAAQPASAGASSWAALSNGECSLETKQLYSPARLCCLVKNWFLRHSGWSEMDGLRRLGVARLMMRHPYRGDGSILVISMNRASAWRELFRFESTYPSSNRPPDVQAGSGRKWIAVGCGTIKRSSV